MLPRLVNGEQTTIATVALIIGVGCQINVAGNVVEVEEAAGTVK